MTTIDDRREAPRLLRCVATRDREGIRILTTHSDHKSLCVHLAALALEALAQPAGTDAARHFLDQAFSALSEGGRP